MLAESSYTKAKSHLKRRESPRSRQSDSIDMNRVASIILGGGQGTRLFPLTVTRCKPAISFGGRYRLIDVPISNSINSGCQKIFIVTQFLSSSLHQHIFKTYHRDTFSSGFIELLPAEQRAYDSGWFQGTADAVRQNIDYFIETPVDYFLILSGDQLYNMDFRKMLQFARKSNADMVVAAIPINEQDTKRMGVLKIDENSFIREFIEKPQEASLIEEFQLPDHASRDKGRHYLGSMGIYLFKRDVLLDLLSHDPREDFGKHLIPTQVERGSSAAYVHDGYWEDIGTIDSFFQANMALTRKNSSFNCYDEANPIFSLRYNLPGPKISDTKITNVIICEGAIVDALEVSDSILGPRTMVKKGTIIRNSYIMGNDYYTPPIRTARLPEKLSIGEHCLLDRVIVDKHVFIGNNVELTNKQNLNHYDGDNVYIRDGIIIVPRGVSLPDGFKL